MQPLLWITVAIALCLTSTSCRFGNRVETRASSGSFQGYYSTAPHELEFCTNAPGGCRSVDVAGMPALLTTALTDPVAVLVQDLKTGQGHLVASDGSGYALPIFVSDQGVLSYGGASQVEPFLRDPACVTQFQLTEEGQAQQVGGMGQSTSGKTLSGRVTLSFHYYQVIDGDCDATMQSVLDCYQDATLCGEPTAQANTDLQKETQALFRPYIEAGTMTVQDIPTIRAMSFTAHYK